MTPEVIPWMSPCLSQSMSFVLAGIGHPMKFRRGDVIYTSPGLFGNLMYVRSGFVVKALLDPVRDEPLLLSMAGPGALCGNYPEFADLFYAYGVLDSGRFIGESSHLVGLGSNQASFYLRA